MSSTLVETVSINYEDFHDSFLTCGTCLCNYDSAEHPPKLLPCSHTVCRPCLEHIVAASRERNAIRCPICRGTVPLPAGGVASFPPSFLVNQLLDLMARQRRDIIPKCTLHPTQELMFCESCDQVFCQDCTGGSHNGRGASAHTVIPFSIAIKRMSEILLYKATQCMKNLDRAAQVVAGEIEEVQASSETCMDIISDTFAELLAVVEERRRELIKAVQRVCEDKKRVLREQLAIIENENARVEAECTGLQQQVEVRNITKKIADLNEKLDMSSNLVEPRENAFVKLEFTHNAAILDLKAALDTFGRIRISKTFPALCTATLDPPTIHLPAIATVSTVDYHGNPRSSGSDPITASVMHENGEELECAVHDHNSGKYSVVFTPHTPGTHTLNIEIFGRPIGESPLVCDVTPHHNPVAKVGSRGVGELQFVQPLGVVMATADTVMVLDTGNSRVQVLCPSDLSFRSQLAQHGLEEHSGTGLALTPRGSLLVTNWRTRHVTEVNTHTGDVLLKFTSPRFQEPISVAVNARGEIFVADNGLGKLLVFDSRGGFLREMGARGDAPGQLKHVTCVYAHGDTILVSDHRLQLFSRTGNFLRELPGAPTRGRYGGVTVDSHGNILATHQDKHGACVLLMDPDGTLQFTMDSHGDKLKRPGGLAATGDGHVLVADLGNDVLKKYRYI